MGYLQALRDSHPLRDWLGFYVWVPCQVGDVRPGRHRVVESFWMHKEGVGDLPFIRLAGFFDPVPCSSVDLRNEPQPPCRCLICRRRVEEPT